MVPDVPAGDPAALDAEGYEEWGLGGMIQLDPGTRGEELQVRDRD